MLFDQFQPICAIATNPQGARILENVASNLNATLWISPQITNIKGQIYQDSLKHHIASLWHTNKALIFCLATGAVVRLISDLLTDKNTDPAVIVIDYNGKFVISLCGGHQAGADLLTQLIASELGATPIITGASYGLKLPALDTLGFPFGWQRGNGDWLGIQTAIAHNDTIEIIQEAGSTLWQNGLPKNHPFTFGFTEYTSTNKPTYISKGRLWISPTKRQFANESDLPKAQWYPRVLWVGIGCERDTSKELITLAIEKVCQRYHLAIEAIAKIVTIDLKADEVGLLAFCQEKDLLLITFSAERLNNVNVPNPSEIVKQEVGTASVAEAAAILGVNEFLATHQQEVIANPLIVKKQIIKETNQKGAVTVAITQSTLEYTGRFGQILLVGIGPGNLNQMTPAAKTAVTQADVIIGYSVYLDLIKTLYRPGQIIEAFPITQEKQRAMRAIELAQWGLNVGVISSGDIGVYGMAGLVLEMLQARGWDGKTPQVEVLPGITAVTAAAARVGAPLMHDFCTISLSDLLTPWEVIEKRLIAAASADFVTAIYNPRSQNRTQQIVEAHNIFLQFRQGKTPIALVRAVYREDENITITSLEKMLDYPIDMFTTVIIGNSKTRNYSNWMITPRGYDSLV